MDLRTDVIIVGSGIAGALLACEVASKGASVILMEAGPRVNRAEAVLRFQAAYPKTPESAYQQSTFTPHPRTEDPEGFYRQKGPQFFNSTYLRQVGGTTWHWLGTAIRLIPDDFRMKSLFGLAMDWPIAYADLEPWYCQAEREMGVSGDGAIDLGSPRSAPYPLPPIPQSYLDQRWSQALRNTKFDLSATPQARLSRASDSRPSCHGAASCIPVCPIQAKYDATIHISRAENLGVQLLTESCANFLECHQDGSVTAVHYKRPDGSEGRILPKVVVIAANGMETPRLLLVSRTKALPNGVANRSGLVGCNLMDHPIQLSWALAREPVWPYRGPGSTSGIENFRRSSERANNSALRFEIGNEGWSWPTGAPESTARELAMRGLSGQELDTALRDETSRHVRIAALTEQLPLKENRVSLDWGRIEPTGLPAIEVSYRLDDYTQRALVRARQLHEEMFKRLGVSSLWHKQEVQAAGHIIGTARMGEDPKQSIVNKNLRAHDHRNLFVIGSSTFPTCGTANPTLTIAALAIRAAEPVLKSLAEATEQL